MDKHIHIIVSTHQGRLYNEYCDHIVVKNKEGEFAIYPDHLAVITSFEEGLLFPVQIDKFHLIFPVKKCSFEKLTEVRKKKQSLINYTCK